MSAAAVGFPNWVLLEPYVCRKDDDESFPDESDAPIRASGITSWGADFRIAFSLFLPPRISRLYAQLPVPLLPPRFRSTPVGILATHRHLALLPFTTNTPSGGVVQDFFIFRANLSDPSKSLLEMLPHCTEPKFDYYYHDDNSLHGPSDGTPRLLKLKSLGLWCGDEDEFVVAELTTYIPSHNRAEAFADICMLLGNCTWLAADGRPLPAQQQVAGGRWMSMRVEISASGGDLMKLCHWQTDTAISFQQWLCWTDYHQGILFCDMSKVPTAPTVSFLSLPPESPRTDNMLYSGVSVVHQGRALKLANVTYHDGLASSNGFTITCHTLVFGRSTESKDVVLGCSMKWEKDYTVTSDDLGNFYIPDCLQHGTLKFPRVDIDRPHVVHFLSIGFGYAKNKMWVVSIDMCTKTVDSYLYMDVKENLPADDADFLIKRLTSPVPFLPCEFSGF